MIVTNSADTHADLVANKISASGLRPFRLDLDRFPAEFDFNIELSGDEGWSGSIDHPHAGDSLTVSDVGAIWTRKTAEFSFISADLGVQEKAYASEEMEHVLFGLLYPMNCYWMSHPSAIRGALWKGEQLLRARQFGFTVPVSIISNQPHSVRQFREDAGGAIIFKSLSSPFLAADKVDDEERVASGLATTLITDECSEMLNSVTEMPCFFQALIVKKYELRVTVIGDAIFAAKIHSQDDSRTSIDYREFDVDIRYESTRLPKEIERRCMNFVHSYGLNYGAIDLIVTPDDEYVFLENNPVGQFLFVERLVPELKMIDAVAECLIRGARAAG